MRRPPQPAPSPAGVAVKGTVEIPKDPKNRGLCRLCHGRGQGHEDGPPGHCPGAGGPHGPGGHPLCLGGDCRPRVPQLPPGHRWYGQVLSAIESEGALYGQSQEGQGKRVMVEFVSANPTGPMHMGNARGGVLGTPWPTSCAGMGMTPGKSSTSTTQATRSISLPSPSRPGTCRSFWERRMSPSPRTATRGGYQGTGPGLPPRARRQLPGCPGGEAAGRLGGVWPGRNVPKMKEDLRRYGIEYDEWFFESTLHQSGFCGGNRGAAHPEGVDL